MQAELNKVRAEKDTMSKELYGYKAQSEGAVGRIESLNYENKKLAALKDELEAKVASLSMELSNMKSVVEQKTAQATTQQEKADKLQAELKIEKVDNEKMGKVLQAVNSAFEKFKGTQSAIESTLSCLSCLAYLKEPAPQTLVCGHSICNKVSTFLY